MYSVYVYRVSSIEYTVQKQKTTRFVVNEPMNKLAKEESKVKKQGKAIHM